MLLIACPGLQNDFDTLRRAVGFPTFCQAGLEVNTEGVKALRTTLM